MKSKAEYEAWKSNFLKRKQKQDFINREMERRMTFYVQFILTSYISLLNDYAITLVDRLYEHYTKSKTYQKNVRFRELLDEVKHSSDETYDYMNHTVKDEQFYADLRDGATKFLDKNLPSLFDEIRQVYKDSHVANDRLVSACSLIFIIIQCIQYRIEEMEESLKHAHLSINRGLKPYKMEATKKGIMCLHDLMGRDYDEQYTQKFQDTLEKIGEVMTPSHLIRYAGDYAFTYNPRRENEFKKYVAQTLDFTW